MVGIEHERFIRSQLFGYPGYMGKIKFMTKADFKLECSIPLFTTIRYSFQRFVGMYSAGINWYLFNLIITE